MWPRTSAFLVCVAMGMPVFALEHALLSKPDTWYASEEARSVAASILSFQSPLGGWPKNVTTTTQPFAGRAEELSPTFDNSATTDELRFLARMYIATNDPVYRASFIRGFEYILNAQYPTGGWPQSFPPGRGYARHITFNDNAMVRLMEFLRDVASAPGYRFLEEDTRTRAQAAFDRGIDCILKCQIRVRGQLTAWCAQHDEVDYSPRAARAFEPAALSGGESVGIVRLLMSLENPSPQVIKSIEAAIAWFESAKLPGIRVETQPDPNSPTGKNRVVIHDPSAEPMWARFYDIETNQPMFVDRDGARREKLSDLSYERRNGYLWLSYWPKQLLASDYPAWRNRQAE